MPPSLHRQGQRGYMDEGFDLMGVLWRLVFALALVLLTFNPTGHSYYHWLLDGFPSIQPAEAVAGIALLIAWVFFVRSTLSAIGTLGLVLMLAFFASVVWWVVSKGWLDLGNRQAVAGSCCSCSGWCSASACRGRTSAAWLVRPDVGGPGRRLTAPLSAPASAASPSARYRAGSASARRTGSCASSPASGG